jgi:hypothetical protein
MKRQLAYFAIALLTLILGLLWRFVFIGLPPFLYKYGGSMLWAAMIYWIAALLAPQTRPLKLAVICGVIATAVEFFKLVHTPALDAFRLTFWGKVLIGQFFYWSGILAYWIAIAAAGLADSALRRNID